MKATVSVRTKVYLLIASLVLVTLLTSLSLTYYLVYSQQETMIRGQIRQTVDDKTQYFGEWLAGKIGFLNTAYWYKEYSDGKIYFEQSFMEANGISDIYEGYEDGSFHSWGGWVPPEGYDPRVRPWYRAVMAEGKQIITDPYFDLTSKKMAVSIGKPVFFKGEKKGVLGADVLIQTVLEKARSIDFGKYGYVWIVNERGIFIIHPDPKLQGQHIQDTPELNILIPRTVTDTVTEIRYQYEGEKRTAYFRTIPESGWVLGTTLIENQAFSYLKGLQMLFLTIAVVLSGVFILLSFLLTRILSEPIIQIIGFVRRVSEGDLNQRLHIHFNTDIDQLAESLNEMAARLRNSFEVIELQKLELSNYAESLDQQVRDRTRELETANKALLFSKAELEKQASIDYLTGLLNRRQFYLLAEKEISKSLRNGNSLCLLIVDLDDFKKINDTYGHLIGDEVLKCTARTVEEVLRDYDILARYGGEEFVALLPDTEAEESVAIAERIGSKLAQQQITAETERIRFTGSLGVAISLPGSRNIEELISMADKALYAAKANGKNRTVAYWEIEN